ncbi:MAG: hypothetical protein A3C54_06405 [Deltaproteobacteria bacterium RIFCSPHIGHO2_02_FULL_60_17]|nr:MAG: hypothetical protein A3C54_06405 [Deltaproteobacteria bacterium RIFCSPHIGHO2_02_FULL_60_17]
MAHAANGVFLSNDVAESAATYVIQFESVVRDHIDKIRITLPPDANTANAALGGVIISDKVFEGDEDHKKDVTLSVDPPDTLIM